jgi:hypothetical protein
MASDFGAGSIPPRCRELVPIPIGPSVNLSASSRALVEQQFVALGDEVVDHACTVYN